MKTFVTDSSAGRAMRPAALRRNVLQTSLRLALASLPLLAAAAWAQPGAQQQAARAYEIAAGPLAEALSRFGAASGLLISVDARLTAQRQSPGLRGSYGPDEGLQALLAGTGLVAQRTPQGALALVPAPQAGKGALQLAPLRVQGAAGSAGLALHASEQEAALAPYREAGSSVHISRETLERFRGTSPGDMLKGVAGVQLGDVRNGHSLDVNIRGLQGQGRVAVVVDGSQQSLDVYRGYAGQQQRSYLDPDLIGSVTVEKGPGLSLDGAGAIGGVVSMQTLGVGDVLSAGQDSGWRLRGGLASSSVREQPGFKVFNRSRPEGVHAPASYFGSVAWAQRSEKLDLVAAYVKRRQGNYFAGKEGVERYTSTKSGWRGPIVTPDKVLEHYRAGEEVLNTHSASQSLLLKSTWRPNTDQTLELGLRHLDAEYGEVMPSAMVRTPASTQWTTYVDPENTMQQFEPGRMKLSALSAQHRWQPAGQSLIDLKSRLWYTRSDSTMFNGVVGTNPLGSDLPNSAGGDPQGEGYTTALRSNVRGQRWGAQIGNSSQFFFGGQQSLAASYGLSYTHESTGPGSASPVVLGDQIRNRYVRSAVRKEASLVGSLEWKPIEALSLLAGGRWIQYEVTDRNREARITATTKVPRRNVTVTKNGKMLEHVVWHPDAKGEFTEASLRASPHRLGNVDKLGFDGWNLWKNDGAFMDELPSAWRFGEPLQRKTAKFAPSFSASYRPSPDSLLYARYAEGYKMPSVFEATRGNHFITPNPHLRPEHNRSWELGASMSQRALLSAQDRLSLKLARFDNRVRDYITRSSNPETYAFTMSNMERFETAGWELQSAYDRGDFYAEISGTYYDRARTCDAPSAAALRNLEWGAIKNAPDCVDGGFGGSYANTQNPPKFSVNTTLGLRLLDQRLNLGTRVVRNSAPLHRLNEKWHSYAYTTQQQYYPATLTVDLFGSYKLSKQAELNLALDNAADRYYLDPLALSPMPAPGRTLRVDFSARF
ncbi:hemoglobin/transferrin/lactoferrin receptor protein [Paucibacter oligotrophus]|uniref:Hemoglobin/transferrin/lactoferrin receptor protein n=1 Tax=Roseateles oligotrophus TaxID=1769250 RepID=A0A840L9S7_9BURK|nr:TonB-dependent receptor [Roseateles oligotrophus]MBB4842948.1 hemoglobin/transferrin/lactoferrin receptor protein [Roseateles oligotrophus]